MTSACQLSRNDSVEAETDAGFIQREVAKISIHSARVGGDRYIRCKSPALPAFQSTPPVWAETIIGVGDRLAQLISIHSARVGGDQHPLCLRRHRYNFNPLRPCGRRLELRVFLFLYQNFNPLRPCGRRLAKWENKITRELFQSTPPVWAETSPYSCTKRSYAISIHSARVGGDHMRSLILRRCSAFQSTPPVWAETAVSRSSICNRRFQSTPPVWAETLRAIHPIPVVNIFQSTPPVWAETFND